jgi:hypothetical protein
MKEMVRGMVMEVRTAVLQARHLTSFNRDVDLNEIDESDRQREKHLQQRISPFRRIMID